MEKTYTLYAHVNLTNGKIYVGQTCKKNIDDRWRKGKGYIRCSKFEAAIKKYGWDGFEHIVLASGLSYEECDYWENRLTEVWNTVNKGYNMRNGGITTPKGSLGRKHDDEWKIKQSIRWTGDGNPMRNKDNSGPNNSFYGRHHTEETKKKISIKNSGKNGPNLGRKFSDEVRKKQSRPVIQMDKNGTIIKEYYGMGIASEETGIRKTNIYECCKGKRRSACGYKWAYKYPKDRETKVFINKRKRKVTQYDEHMNAVKEYESVKEAAKANGVSYTAISNCCRGITNSSNGFVFKYSEDKESHKNEWAESSVS